MRIREKRRFGYKKRLKTRETTFSMQNEATALWPPDYFWSALPF